MRELNYALFQMLRLVRYFCDTPRWEKVKEKFSHMDLNDEDSVFEFSYEAISWVFDDTTTDFNEDYEMEVWIFCDPIIDNFARLCHEYEKRNGLSEENSPYRQQVRTVICEGFRNISGYSYDFDWRLSARDRGRKRILFFNGPDFWDMAALPVALMEIRTGLEALNRQLERELKIISLPVQAEWKEAA